METAKAVCGKEALELLNCVTESNFDELKCLQFLQSLRQCVLSKKVKKFSLPEQKQQEGMEGSGTQS
ncbi:hypothetical protein RND81_08G108400 [Saponaria officinalis]|uniref:Cysteine alpha-hairpin motif superfamily n=1 Tax=Saponaria officinalis TaxID=3572 RepID=A0AAW1J629_SAPOF